MCICICVCACLCILSASCKGCVCVYIYVCICVCVCTHLCVSVSLPPVPCVCVCTSQCTRLPDKTREMDGLVLKGGNCRSSQRGPALTVSQVRWLPHVQRESVVGAVLGHHAGAHGSQHWNQSPCWLCRRPKQVSTFDPNMERSTAITRNLCSGV